MPEITHAELVEVGAKWLFNKGFKVVLKELSTMSLEIPDCLGFNSGHSFLLEAKASRSDFLADKKKWFRHNNARGVGMRRAYICPKGLIKPEELPPKWGLIYVNEKRKPREKVKSGTFEDRHLINEQLMLVSVVRRMIDGFEYKKYLHRSGVISE